MPNAVTVNMSMAFAKQIKSVICLGCYGLLKRLLYSDSELLGVSSSPGHFQAPAK